MMMDLGPAQKALLDAKAAISSALGQKANEEVLKPLVEDCSCSVQLGIIWVVVKIMVPLI